MKAKFPPEILCRVKSVSQHQPAKSVIAVTRVQLWNRRFQKFFKFPKHFHVSDPTGAVRKGDTIGITPWPSLGRSERLTHTVTRIVSAAAADESLAMRPAVLTELERREWRTSRLLEKAAPRTRHALRTGELAVGEGGRVLKPGKETLGKGRKLPGDEQMGKVWDHREGPSVDVVDGVKVVTRSEAPPV